MNYKMETVTSKFAELEFDIDKLTRQIHRHLMHLSNIEDDVLPTAKSLKSVTRQMKDLLKTYQDKTTVLDSTIDVLYNEINTVCQDVETSFRERTDKMIKDIQGQLRVVTSNEAPTLSPRTFVTPSRHHRSKRSVSAQATNTGISAYKRDASPQRQAQRQSTSHDCNQYKGVQMDVIWKMVKFSYNNDTQLLDFYTKLQTAMIQEGIYLRDLRDISEEQPIYD